MFYLQNDREITESVGSSYIRRIKFRKSSLQNNELLTFNLSRAFILCLKTVYNN